MITRYKRLYFELLREVQSFRGGFRKHDCRHQEALQRIKDAEKAAIKRGSRTTLPPLDIDQLP